MPWRWVICKFYATCMTALRVTRYFSISISAWRMAVNDCFVVGYYVHHHRMLWFGLVSRWLASLANMCFARQTQTIAPFMKQASDSPTALQTTHYYTKMLFVLTILATIKIMKWCRKVCSAHSSSRANSSVSFAPTILHFILTVHKIGKKE